MTPMVEQVHVGLLAPKLVPAMVRSVLTSLADEPLLAPTHGSEDERKRIPYDAERVIAAAERGPVELWRTKAPRYTGSLITNRDGRNCLKFSFEPAPSASHLPAIFECATRLTNSVRPVFGFVHMFWMQEPAREAYNFGYRLQARDLDSVGIGNVHARTWFGPYLVELIGKALLLALPSAVELVWGGIQVDLVENPWLADAETLWEAQCGLMKQLRARGVVGTFKGSPQQWKAGPRWVPPGWEPRKRR